MSQSWNYEDPDQCVNSPSGANRYRDRRTANGRDSAYSTVKLYRVRVGNAASQSSSPPVIALFRTCGKSDVQHHHQPPLEPLSVLPPMDAAARRKTYDIPKSDSVGLAEWTSKIKALQRQVDEDEEAETRRLEEDIMTSRMSRMRRSTLQSRPLSYDPCESPLELDDYLDIHPVP